MDPFNMGQLTKEMVTSRIKEIEDPCAVTAAVMEQALMASFKDGKSLEGVQRRAVIDICYGAMTGLLLNDGNLAKGAVEVLRAVHRAAMTLHLDPTEMMKLALRGIARIRLVATSRQLDEIGMKIDQEFMGMSEIFYRERAEEATLPLRRAAPAKDGLAPPA